METAATFSGKSKVNPLDKPIARPKVEVSQSLFALLFSELVQYCQNRAYTVTELQGRLTDLGCHVGQRVVDLHFVRERRLMRETRLLPTLVFVKNVMWKNLFGKEADRLEQATDDETVYYIIETDPMVNQFISVPKDKGTLNCASFAGGIIQSVLTECGFPATVTAIWHQGTTFMIKFEETVIERDRALDTK